MDVAREVGVSINTVSRALRGKRDVSPETKARVLEAAQRLGYRPNKLARGLRSTKTWNLGVVVADIANPFFAAVVKGVENAARTHGYSIILMETDERYEREEEALRVMLSEQVDGLLLTPAQSQRHTVEDLLDGDLPFVLLGRYFSDLDAPYVVTDDARGGFLATEHLLGLGHREIAHVAGPMHISSARDRWAGFINALRANGLPVGKNRAVMDAVRLEDGYRAAQELLGRRVRPTAIFCYSDLVAFGVMRAVLQAGLRIPEDMAIVGYDDMEFCAHAQVPLTTVRIPKRALGEKAVEMLVGNLKPGERAGKRSAKLPVELVIRDSARGVVA